MHSNGGENPTHPALGHAAQIAAAFTWSSALVLMKPLARASDPVAVAALQFCVGACVLWLCVLLFARDKIEIRRLGGGLIFGAVAPGLAFSLNATGVARTDATSVVVLWGLIPFIGPFLARFILGEQIPRGLFGAAVIGFSGALLLTWNRLAGEGDWLGNVIVLGGVVCTASGHVLGRYVNRDAGSPLITAAAQVSGGAIVTVILAVVFGDLATAARDVVSEQLRGLFLWQVAIGTILNFWFFNTAPRHLQAAWISFYTILIPAIGTAMSAGFLGEDLSAIDVAGIAIIMIAAAFPGLSRILARSSK